MKVDDAVYLDHNATTPVDPAVLAAMLPFLGGEFGNPSSAHRLGRRAKDALEAARSEVAALIGAAADEIVFTGGGTEASNLAIRGAVRLRPERRGIVTTAIEHPATAEPCALLEREGYALARLPPGSDGRIGTEAARRAIGLDTALVTLIHAQNEIGTLQPVAAVAAAGRAAGALVHTDAAQSLGKVPVDVDALGVDLLTIAGHKLHAPKGVGALYVRRGVALPPLVVGAGQERGIRPGTENVAFAVGLGAACRLAAAALAGAGETRRRARRLFDRLAAAVPGTVLVGDAEARLPNTVTVLFPGVSGRALLAACPGVLASTGSACHTDHEDPSAVLTALGIGREAALAMVRLSLGRATTDADVDLAAERLAAAWAGLARVPSAAAG